MLNHNLASCSEHSPDDIKSVVDASLRVKSETLDEGMVLDSTVRVGGKESSSNDIQECVATGDGWP